MLTGCSDGNPYAGKYINRTDSTESLVLKSKGKEDGPTVSWLGTYRWQTDSGFWEEGYWEYRAAGSQKGRIYSQTVCYYFPPTIFPPNGKKECDEHFPGTMWLFQMDDTGVRSIRMGDEADDDWFDSSP